MSSITDNVKPAEEFVVFTDDSASPREDKTNAAAAPPTTTGTSDTLSFNTSAPPHPISRIDSFPKTLPLPASSILSPVSDSHRKDTLPSLSEQQTPPASVEDLVSPPEKTSEDMFSQATAFSQTEDPGTSTPLAELAGTAFDQQVALRRRGDSILGEELSEGVSKLAVEEEESTPLVKEISLPPRETFTAEELAARKNDPAVVSALPQTPSAEDFEVAKIQGGANFTPEFTETKVAS